MPKEIVLAWDYLTTYGPERAVFIVRHAVEVAKAVDFPIQTFGRTKNFLPQAIAEWEGHAEVEEARREADARTDEQHRRDHDERERRRRLGELRAALSDEALEALRHRAEEVLAADGVDRARLRYDVLVKLKGNALLNREYRRMDVNDHPERSRERLRTPALARLQRSA